MHKNAYMDSSKRLAQAIATFYAYGPNLLTATVFVTHDMEL